MPRKRPRTYPRTKTWSPDIGQTDEYVIRITAYFVAWICSAGLISGSVYPSLFLAADFGLRAFGVPRFSILKLLGGRAALLLRIPVRPVYAAPKRFAALLGFLFSLLITGFEFAGWQKAANVTGGILIACALLESLFGICVGCHVYSFIQKFNPYSYLPRDRQGRDKS